MRYLWCCDELALLANNTRFMGVSMKKLLAEPLLQFVLLGLVLTLATRLVLPPATIDARYEIIVDEDRLLNFMQTQAKTFQPQQAAAALASMSDENRQRLIDDYSRGEVLFREAMALQLDRDDQIIRRRLIQKMEYIAQGFYDEIAPPSEQQLREYYRQNQEDYRRPAEATFTHVFIGFDRRDPVTAGQIVSELLTTLRQQRVPFEQSGRFGERFLYNRNYAERSDSEIIGHFGDAFAQQLFALPSIDDWQGPIRSDYGYHLVRVKKRSVSTIPPFEQVVGAVLGDTQRQQQRQVKRDSIAAMMSQYRVVVREPNR